MSYYSRLYERIESPSVSELESRQLQRMLRTEEVVPEPTYGMLIVVGLLRTIAPLLLRLEYSPNPYTL